MEAIKVKGHAINRAGRVIQKNLVLVILVVLVLLTAIIEPRFLSSTNIANILRQFGPLAFVSLGMTFVIIAGFIDLSIAGIINLTVVVTITMIDVVGQVPALCVGVLIGAAMGFINSRVLISGGATTQAQALFITYGMSTIYGALALLLSGGSTRQMRTLMSDYSLFQAIGQAGFGVLPLSFVIFVGCLLILYIFQSKTYMGRAINLTGGNKKAANLAGIPVNRSISVIFTLSGLMAAIGAIVLFSRVTSASPLIGEGYETNAILAVVVGGSSLLGGNGSVIKTVLGVLLVTLMSNCLNLLGVSTYMQVVVKGAILVIAIWLDNRSKA